MSNFFTEKRDGKKERYDADKIHDKTIMACEGLSNVSASEIEMNADLQLRDGISTSEIHKNLIDSAAQLISETNPNYEYVASRLLNQQLRKEVYHQYNPLPFLDEIKKRVKLEIYDDYILQKYTEEEIEHFGSKIRYSRDDNYTYTGLSQLYNSYLIKYNGKPIETPQEVSMLMNMIIFADYEPVARKKWVLEGYRILSMFEASLPTPVMNGLRTTYRRFISCNIIDTGDTSKSLAMANAFIMMMTANKSGIGLNTGDIRGLGAMIGYGRVEHTGVLPILKAFEASTGAFTQIGRGGSSNNNYPFFHYEIDLIMELGNAKGTEDTRVRHADHTITFNNLFIERLLKGENITLFHMNEVPGLHDAIGDIEFKELYEGFEKTVKRRHKKTYSASEFADKFLNERFLQGRLYYVFADNAQQQGPWKIPVHTTNLCCLSGDTICSTDRGDVEIKDIVVGDKVKSYNVDSKIVEYKEVEMSMMTKPKSKVMKIIDEITGKSIICTEDHQVWTENRGYVEAGHLKEDDILNII